MIPGIRSKLKTGKRPQKLITKSLKKDEVLFREGSTGRELFIIKEGKVGVYKESHDDLVELAVIEKNGIIGEMSLLDNQPRSATIRALKNTRIIVINEKIFQGALRASPRWLTSIVKIVVSRLRDINRRVDQTVLRDRERGLVSLLLLLLPENKHEFSSRTALEYNLVMVEAYYVCRLKKKETERILQRLEKRNIISILTSTSSTRLICFDDIDIINLYCEFLTLKSQHTSFREVTIPLSEITLLNNIASVAQKSGIETKEGTSLSKSSLAKVISEKNMESFEKSLLGLRRRNLINILPVEKDSIIIFRKDSLSRIKKIKEWLPRFTMEIK